MYESHPIQRDIAKPREWLSWENPSNRASVDDIGPKPIMLATTHGKYWRGGTCLL